MNSMYHKGMLRRLAAFLTVCIIAAMCIPSATAVEIDKSSLPDYVDGEYDSSLPRVIDEADILTDSEEQRLESSIEDIIDEFEFDCVILTVYNYRSYGYYSIQSFADDFYDYGGYGVGSDYDGIILVISMYDRSYAFSTCGYGEEAINDYGLEWIDDDIIGDLGDNDFYGAFKKYVRDVEDFVREAQENKPYDYGHTKISWRRFFSNWTVALIIAAIITATVATGLMAQMKTVLPKPQAKDYLKRYQENYSQDTFLYSNVSKVRRNSGGSGGSSGSHRSSSGRSHGGRSGHF